MWKYKLANFLKFCFSLLLVGVMLFPVLLIYGRAFPTFPNQEYYLYAPSSQASIAEKVKLIDLPYINGECVRIPTEEKEIFLREIIKRYAAKLVAKEVFDGGESYYYFSSKLKNGIRLAQGESVNLHIVIKEKEIVVGTPIVFGGY